MVVGVRRVLYLGIHRVEESFLGAALLAWLFIAFRRLAFLHLWVSSFESPFCWKSFAIGLLDIPRCWKYLAIGSTPLLDLRSGYLLFWIFLSLQLSILALESSSCSNSASIHRPLFLEFSRFIASSSIRRHRGLLSELLLGFGFSRRSMDLFLDLLIFGTTWLRKYLSLDSLRYPYRRISPVIGHQPLWNLSRHYHSFFRIPSPY